MSDNETTVYTIGHSILPVEKVIELLKTNNITTLVDVRSSPYSKYHPQFNRENIRRALEAAGLAYKYFGDSLGGRPDDPQCYKDGQIPDGNADYLHLVDYPAVMTKERFQAGIKQLLALARNERVAVMCSEEDPAKCHRHHLIGRYLVAQEINVLHIRSEGHLIKDQLLPNLPDDPEAEQLKLFEE